MNEQTQIPDELSTLVVSSHLVIRDRETKKEILNKRLS